VVVFQYPRRVQEPQASGPAHHCHVGRGRIRPRRARPGGRRLQEEVVCSEADEKVSDCRDASAAAHHVREGDHGGVRLPVYRQALQDLQGQEVPLHAHGLLPRWRALDHSQVSFHAKVKNSAKVKSYAWFPEFETQNKLSNNFPQSNI
jgi:hypothetical protein